jgi:hypothetical protein
MEKALGGISIKRNDPVLPLLIGDCDGTYSQSSVQPPSKNAFGCSRRKPMVRAFFKARYTTGMFTLPRERSEHSGLGMVLTIQIRWM